MERSDFRPWTLDIPCWILDIQSFQRSLKGSLDIEAEAKEP